MITRHARRFLGFGFAPMLVLSSGCIRVVTPNPEPEDVIAVSPTKLQRESGNIAIADSDLDYIARQADVSPDDIRKVGVGPGDYTRDEVTAMLGQLRTDDEQYFLAFSRKVRAENAGEVQPGAPAEDAPPPPPAPPPDAPPNPVAAAPEGTAEGSGSQAFTLSRLKEVFNHLFNKPEFNPLDLWSQRESVLRTVAAKDATRQWLLARLATHRFEGALNITLEVVSTNKSPVLLGERAFVSISGTHKLSLSRTGRDCNDERNSCRYVYSHFSDNWDASWDEALKSAQAAQDSVDQSATDVNCRGGNRCTAAPLLELEILLAGTVLKRALPVAFMTVGDRRKKNEPREEEP